MVDDLDMKGSKTRKWSAIVVLTQHTIDRVTNCGHTIPILPQR